MLLDSIQKCLAMMTHVVQKFVEHFDPLVSVWWELSLRGIIELTKDLTFCNCLIHYFFINKFYLAILTDHHFPSITILQENFFLSFRDAG